MKYNIENIEYLALLLVVPLVGFLLFRFLRWRSSRKELFAESRFREQLFPKISFFSKIFPAIYLVAFTFLILAMIDFSGEAEETETNQKMNNVIFLFDVSNSMNTEDTTPSRISEAKNILLNSLKQITNSRIGIVVFAGEASSIMPLTSDYTAADIYVDAIETGMVKIQGTDFLKAMEVSVEKFKNIPKGSRQVVLLSDGEDNEGNANAAIALAKEEGISIISVGIGTEEGAPIPDYSLGQLMGYKTDLSGQTVISKRQTSALKQMALETGGEYIDGNNLDSAIKSVTESLKNMESSTTSMVKSSNSTHYYQYFLAVSLFLFFVIYIFNPRRDLNV